MELLTFSLRSVAAATIGLALLGCGGEGNDGAGSIAQALDYESKERVAAQQMEKARQVELQAEAEKKRRVQQAITEEMNRIVALPAEMPSNLEETCDRLVTAYDAYMKSLPDEREAIEWYQGRLKKVGQRRGNCLKQASVQAGACQASALEQATDQIKQLGQEGAQQLMLACAKNYGGSQLLSRVAEEPADEADAAAAGEKSALNSGT